jgi:transposase
MLTESHDEEQIIARVAAPGYRQGGGGVLCAGPRRAEAAFNGHFDHHYGFLLTRTLGHIDAIDADIAAIDAQIEAQSAPFASAAARLDDIPGIGPGCRRDHPGRGGVEMSRSLPPGTCVRGEVLFRYLLLGRQVQGQPIQRTRGNRYLAKVLGESAVVAGRTDSFVGERYRRIAKHRGKKRAIVAVSRSILVIVCHLLSDDQAIFTDLSADHFTRHVNSEPKKRNDIRQLEALGYNVSLSPAA